MDPTSSNVHGLLQTIGRTRYLSVVYQDLLSTQRNHTSDYGAQNKTYRVCDEMPAKFGGRQNYWRFLDGQNLVRFSPTMDLATVVAKLFDHPHPGTHHQRERTHLECFTQPCSIDLLCRTILSLLRERNSNSGRDSGKKFMKQSQPDRVDWTVRRRANRAKQLRYLYTSISSTSQQSYRTISDDKEYVPNFEQAASPGLEIVNTTEHDEAELYNWSQNLPSTLTGVDESECFTVHNWL
ncbi:hypothetical protein FBUS_01693 [Fasciolopsis buskii]|uniref:Uncharacterized protein n=1 Tax=Fasciolopsis buskii TaxID=27845 RepID=A0A8E0RTU9_9TREM|nr:hypothetical protein FBUS_01693 [Fasciolopsis buski]